MAKRHPRNLEVAVYKGSQRQEKFDASADPDDNAELEGILTGWLEGHGWKPGTWHKFRLEVRDDGHGGRVRKTVYT